MSVVVTNTSQLPVALKIVKGQDIITKSTSNPDAPGNAAALAAFVTAQEGLVTANADCEANRQEGLELTSARDAALVVWNGALAGLAGVTQSVTGGVAHKILSTGFDVRAEPTPPQPVAQIENVKVTFTGMPGYSEVRWKRDGNAEAYVLERSPDPITATSWDNVGTVTEAKYEGNGAIPGQKYWYRVAAVNKLGQGAWSEPALRPVM